MKNKTNKGFAPLITILAVATILTFGIAAYFIYKTNTSIITTTLPSSNSTKTDLSQYKNMTYLKTIIDDKKFIVRKAFITLGKDDTTILYLADQNLSPKSWKKVHQLELGAYGYGDVNKHWGKSNYFSIAYGGADFSDLVIFDIDGNVITDSITESNEKLKDWALYYDGDIGNNIIKVELVRIDGSSATAEVDTSTGKMVPNSFKKTK